MSSLDNQVYPVYRPAMKMIPILLALAVAQGCSTTYRQPDQVSADTTVTRDRYAGTTSVKAPKIGYGSHWRSQCLLMAIQDQGVTQYQLVVRSVHPGWKFLDHARDAKGRELETIVLDRVVFHGDTVEEHVSVLMDRDYLESIPPDNLDVKLFGDRGSEVVRLGPEYVRGFLDRVDQVLGPENGQTVGNLSDR